MYRTDPATGKKIEVKDERKRSLVDWIFILLPAYIGLAVTTIGIAVAILVGAQVTTNTEVNDAQQAQIAQQKLAAVVAQGLSVTNCRTGNVLYAITLTRAQLADKLSKSLQAQNIELTDEEKAAGTEANSLIPIRNCSASVASGKNIYLNKNTQLTTIRNILVHHRLPIYDVMGNFLRFEEWPPESTFEPSDIPDAVQNRLENVR